MEIHLRNYSEKSSSEVALRYGKRLTRGLKRRNETAGLATALEVAQSGLLAAKKAREGLEEPLDDASDDVAFAEVECEGILRRVNLRARELDGDRVGPISEVGFPDGLTPVIIPKGASQVAAAALVAKRSTESAAPELQPQKAELSGLAAQALAAIDAPYQAWLAARKAHAEAFDVEQIRREEHRRVVDAIFGGVRQAFPGDSKLQDALVPSVRARASDTDKPDVDAPTPTPTA